MLKFVLCHWVPNYLNKVKPRKDGQSTEKLKCHTILNKHFDQPLNVLARAVIFKAYDAPSMLKVLSSLP